MAIGEVTVKIEVDASKFKRQLEKLNRLPVVALEAGGDYLWAYLIEYHSRMDWQGEDWFPGEYSGQFAQKVVEGWQKPTRFGRTIRIRNTFGLLKWKTTGGSIRPKRAPYLTIPLVPEARGKLVGQFASESGERLFKAGNALCRKIGKKIEAVYALSKGVQQFPVARAMPSQHDMEVEVNKGVRMALREMKG